MGVPVVYNLAVNMCMEWLWRFPWSTTWQGACVKSSYGVPVVYNLAGNMCKEWLWGFPWSTTWQETCVRSGYAGSRGLQPGREHV